MTETIDLARLFTETEWELLCDRCGLCCLYKIDDYETGEYLLTRVACPFLDTQCGNCTSYSERFEKMPTCARISPHAIDLARFWMPKHCAYRCIYERRPLPAWHPLFTAPERNQTEERLLAKIARLVKTEHAVPLIEAEEVLSIRQNAVKPNPNQKLDYQLIGNVIEAPLI